MDQIEHHDVELTDLRRSERTMLIARAVGAPWAFLQIFTFSLPYPPGVKVRAIALATLLLVGNLAVFLAYRRARTLRAAQLLAGASLSLDLLVISGIVWLYAFDPTSALWAVLFILPLEGAMRFQLQGALATWAGATLLYIGREFAGSERYGYPLEWNSITFRMGIGLIIALVAGLMARDLMRQRARLAQTVDRLQDVDRLRAALVSTMAHDVRNPLTAIRGSIQTLLGRPELVGTEAATQLLSSADRQADRLSRLANDLLDLARLEQGRLELNIEPVVLKHSVDTSLSFVESAYRIENRIEPQLCVEADPDRLQQVVVNLASNALRYGEPPFIAEGRARGDHVELIFKDHGPGIEPEEQATLFEPFGAAAGRGSVGFGLAIVKALVEAQRGRVSYEPNHPRGACFKVILPAAGRTATA
ncbi:MAG TPA: HAMP domain-containing sensor histidine kinase [Actinomycetota bacterium]|nr:HAMP domain-containing sensor histidine kinase [Actinomycetota bacterium]